MENLQEPRYQRREQTPPLVKINLLEAIAAIVIVVIFVVGFHAILPLASYAVYLSRPLIPARRSGAGSPRRCCGCGWR